jgi:DNA-binding NtrC family response regulator
VRGLVGAVGRELEFILRSLVELKLQVEELRRRTEEDRAERERWLASGGLPALGAGIEALEPRDQPPPPNAVTVRPGMTMAEIERLAIESALKETRGNRRRAAEMLGIGERTLYRKLREYQLPETLGMLE